MPEEWTMGYETALEEKSVWLEWPRRDSRKRWHFSGVIKKYKDFIGEGGRQDLSGRCNGMNKNQQGKKAQRKSRKWCVDMLGGKKYIREKRREIKMLTANSDHLLQVRQLWKVLYAHHATESSHSWKGQVSFPFPVDGWRNQRAAGSSDLPDIA